MKIRGLNILQRFWFCPKAADPEQAQIVVEQAEWRLRREPWVPLFITEEMARQVLLLEDIQAVVAEAREARETAVRR